MLVRKSQDLPPSEITSKPLYLRRREFLQALPLAGRMVTTTDSPTPYRGVTTYNNFYEFGTDKSDPAAYGNRFKPRPWSVTVAGECAKPGAYTLEDILKPHSLEERVYRMRCVEGWSMNPLAIMAVGLYGETLLPQNGAPIRLVVPWKYGFKSIKSIVKIDFVRRQPRSSWEENWPEAYGFYSNVNPTKDHPGHSQARERRVGEFFTRPTLMFNGYGDQVASLYKAMDLRRFY